MPAKPNTPQKILIINIFGIGDVLFTTPLISNLKLYNPAIYVGYVCNRRTASLMERQSGVDKVFVYERDEFKEAGRRSKWGMGRKVTQFVRDIKAEKFDVSLDVSLSDFTGWVTKAAGIKRRVGFKYKNRGFFLNEALPLKGYESKHVVDYYLDLLQHIDIPIVKRKLVLEINQTESDWAKQFLTSTIGVQKRQPIIGLVPGGGASWGKDADFKRWAPENYAKLADNLIENFSAAIILMGDKSELDLCAAVKNNMVHLPVLACGETTLSQFAALARKCSLMIVNDGGPLHMAVAAGARTVSIFGPVDDRVYGPYPQENHIVIKKGLACQPCYRRFRRASCDHISCLRDLSVDEVFEQVKNGL